MKLTWLSYKMKFKIARIYFVLTAVLTFTLELNLSYETYKFVPVFYIFMGFVVFMLANFNLGIKKGRSKYTWSIGS
jgi:hypothetical protein